MASVSQEHKCEIAKVIFHVGLELGAIDVLILVAVDNEVGEGSAGCHQGGLVLLVGDRQGTDEWVLVSKDAHPLVSGLLVEFIPKGNARLGKLLCSGTEVGEVSIEQPGNKVHDPFGGNLRVHATEGEGAREDNTPEQIDTIIRGDIGSGNTSHGPTTDIVQCVGWKIRILRTSQIGPASCL